MLTCCERGGTGDGKNNSRGSDSDSEGSVSDSGSYLSEESAGPAAHRAKRDAELAELGALSADQRASKLKAYGWITPSTGHHFDVADVTRLPGSKAPAVVKAHVRHWLPPPGVTIKATMFFCHGMHVHVNAKPTIAFYDDMSARGYATFAMDLPGHGFSEGENRCMIPDFQGCFDAHEALMRFVLGGCAQDDKAEVALGVDSAVLAALRGKPFFVVGESMGGMIAAFLAQQVAKGTSRELAGGFRGALLLCPSLVVDLPPPPVLWFLRSCVVPAVPHWTMPNSLSSSAATKPYDIFDDAVEQDMITLDNYHMPECGWPGTPGALGWRHGLRWSTANAFLKAFARLEGLMDSIAYPFLVLHDPHDKICFFKGSTDLMDRSRSSDKTLTRVEGGLHGLCANRREEVAQAMDAWMGQRL
mmetsp:Transcript_14296/g.42551  ORF Transcript_14296/g.42551 Transcript_14296/m.42551 type:complete len:416 (-) Transcript_14296:63-1310(-)